RLSRATGAGVYRFFIFIVGGERSVRHILPRAFAWVNQAAEAQVFPCLQIAGTPLALNIRGKRSADVRAFIPIKPKPVQILDDRVGKFSAATIVLQIFDP